MVIKRPNLWNRGLVAIGIQSDYVREPCSFEATRPVRLQARFCLLLPVLALSAEPLTLATLARYALGLLVQAHLRVLGGELVTPFATRLL